MEAQITCSPIIWDCIRLNTITNPHVLTTMSLVLIPPLHGHKLRIDGEVLTGHPHFLQNVLVGVVC